jgi:hypothetical protein
MQISSVTNLCLTELSAIPSVQRVTLRHVPPSRTVDNRSHFPEIGKFRNHLANIAVQ